MKLATNIIRSSDMGYQLIFNDSFWVLGINLLIKDKVLIKKRFNNAIEIISKQEETELVNRVFIETITGESNTPISKQQNV